MRFALFLYISHTNTSTMRKYNDGQGAAYTAMVAMAMIIFAMLCGCNVQKKIDKAVTEAIQIDRVLHPCANDTTILTTPGETLVLIDTVRTHTTDTLALTPDTLRETITITKLRTDTVMAVVVDKRLVEQYKDTATSYKLKLANLRGENSQLRETLSQSEKKATNRLLWLLGVICGIAIAGVIWVINKIKPL